MKWSTYNTSFKNVFIYKHRHKNWTKTQNIEHQTRTKVCDYSNESEK